MNTLARCLGLLLGIAALCGIAPGDRLIVAAALSVRGVESPVPVPILIGEQGRTAGIDEVADRILTVRAIDAAHQSALLGVAGTSVTYRATVDANTDRIDGLVSVGSDAESAALDGRFGGRTVWTIASLQAICADGPAAAMRVVGRDVPVRIEHIVRLTGFPTRFEDVDKLSGAGAGYSYKTENPLLVTLRVPLPPAESHDTRCDELSARFAGRWDFERLFRATSLRAAHPAWSAREFDEVKAGRILTGMSREQIVAIFGYPSLPGTLAQINGLDRWFYAEPGPFGWNVYFRADHVWAYDPPATLP